MSILVSSNRGWQSIAVIAMALALPLALLLALLVGATWWSTGQSATEAQPTTPAASGTSEADLPRFSFYSIDGQAFSTERLLGKPTLVTFWSTTCAPCLEEIPELQSLHAHFSPQGLQMIAIAMPYDPPAQVVAFAKRHGLAYPVALDPGGEINRAFGGVERLPLSLLYGADGSPQRRVLGKVDASLTQSIESLIERRAGGPITTAMATAMDARGPMPVETGAAGWQ